MEPFEHITRLLHGPPPKETPSPDAIAHDPTNMAARGQSAELLGQPPPTPASPADAQAADLSRADSIAHDPVAPCVAERGGDLAYRDAGLPDPAEIAALTADCEARERGAADPIDAPAPIPTRRVLDALATGRWDTDSLAARLSDAQLATLPSPERAALIDHIARGAWVDGEDEATLVRLIATAPEPSALLDALRADRAALLRQLDEVIGGDAYTPYRRALRSVVFAAQTPAEAAAAMDDAAGLPWADPGLIGALLGERLVVYETVEYTDESTIDIAGHVTAGPLGVPFERRGLDPLDLVAVRYFADEAAWEAGAGETQYMPAAEFVGLYHKQRGQMREELTDLALVGLGGVGVVGAAGRLGKVVAAIEAAIGAADLVIRSERDAIAGSEDGRRFLSVWDKVVTLTALYGAAQVAVSVPHFVSAAQQSWRRVSGRVDPAARRAVDDQLAALEAAAAEARAAQAPEGARPAGAAELDEAAKLDDAAPTRVADDADVEAPAERVPEDPEAAFDAEVRHHLVTTEKQDMEAILRAYEFLHEADIPARARTIWEETFIAEYAALVRAGKAGKPARKAARKVAVRRAKAFATEQAEAAARARALDDLATGAVFGPNQPASMRATEAAYHAGQVGQVARELSPRLAGKSMDEVQELLEAEAAAGRCTAVDAPITTKKGVTVPQRAYTYPDGTFVRVKPEGDGFEISDSSPPDDRPKYSVEVLNVGTKRSINQEDVAFKLDQWGSPVPKGPESARIPYDKGVNREQYEAYAEAVAEAGHHVARRTE